MATAYPGGLRKRGGLLDYEDTIQATPRNPFFGGVAGLLEQSYKQKMPRIGVPGLDLVAANKNLLLDLLGVGDVQKTAEAMSYGGRLGTGAGMTYRLLPETMGAAMTVAPMARFTKGLPVGMGIKDVSYRSGHLAPGPHFGAPLYDLTGGGQMYPADVYSSKAAQYYGTGYAKADKDAFELAKKVRGNPDAEVTMYRAVPKDENITNINAGDWVTLSKDYAKNHGESVLGNDYKIISQKVKAKELWTNADSIHEFGYNPQQSTYPQQAALDLAQQRAALPVSEGGLGLPAGNTAEQRAAAMGFDVEKSYIHSARIPFTKINEDGKFSGIFTLPNYSANYGTLDMPLVARGEIATSNDLLRLVKRPTKKIQMAIDEIIPENVDVADATVEMQKLRNELARKYGFSGVKVSDEFGGDTTALVNPDNVRSRFAAFDPFRKTAATAAAMGVAAPDLMANPVDEEELRRLQSGLLYAP